VAGDRFGVEGAGGVIPLPPAARLYAYGGGLLALLIGLGLLHHHGYRKGVDAERARYEAGLAEAGQRYAAQVERDARTNQEAVSAYESEVAHLRAAAVPVGPVRLCRDPVRAGEVPAVPRVAAGTGGSAAAAGSVPGVSGGTAVGPDIGPGLQLIADRGDRLSAQVRHLLERNRKLSELASEER